MSSTRANAGRGVLADVPKSPFGLFGPRPRRLDVTREDPDEIRLEDDPERHECRSARQSDRHLRPSRRRQRRDLDLGGHRVGGPPGTPRHGIPRLCARLAPCGRPRPYRGDRQCGAQADAGGQAPPFGRAVLRARAFARGRARGGRDRGDGRRRRNQQFESFKVDRRRSSAPSVSAFFLLAHRGGEYRGSCRGVWRKLPEVRGAASRCSRTNLEHAARRPRLPGAASSARCAAW